MLERVLVQGFTLRQLATRQRGVALATYRYRFRQALRRYVARTTPKPIPPGPLVLLTDGLWFEFDRIPWVLYLTALKAPHGTQAVFLDPLLLPGKEGATRWRQAVAAIPSASQQRIQALVADNLTGMQRLARDHRWALQLCHFHLLLKLQVHRRGVRYTLRGGRVREELYQLIRTALALPEGRRLRGTLARLHRLADGDCGTRRIQAAVREFLQSVGYYRTYLAHPRLRLPLTTNAVESMGRLIREMLRRSRAGSNPRSVLLWATAFIRLRGPITCNGHGVNR